MIGKTGRGLRGRRVEGLLWYLYGPGRANEHENPRIVAAWLEDTGLLEPEMTARGKRDFRGLVKALADPLRGVADARRPDKPVWHTVLRAAPEDPVLSDEQWGEIARRVMRRLELAGDPGAPERDVRWIAVRHDDHGIHLVALMARQDGSVPRLSRDFHRLREVCRWAEREYGLRATNPGDRTAARPAVRAEQEKSTRLGRVEDPRVVLRRAVRQAAAGARSADEFAGGLERAGCLLRLRRDSTGTAVGLTVALPGYRTKSGDPVWYSGGSLAPDLTWPRLNRRWGAAEAAQSLRAGTTVLSPDRTGRAVSTVVPSTATRTPRPGSSVPDPGGNEVASAPNLSQDASMSVPGGTHHADRTSDGGGPGDSADGPNTTPRPEAPAAPVGPVPAGRTRRDELLEAAAAARRAANQLATDPDAVEQMAGGAGDLVTATGWSVEGARPGPVTAACDQFERASRSRWRLLDRWNDVGHQLHLAATRIINAGRVVRGDERASWLLLASQTAGLADAVATAHEARDARDQAAAARAAAAGLRQRMQALAQQQRQAAARAARPETSTSPTPGVAQEPARPAPRLVPPTPGVVPPRNPPPRGRDEPRPGAGR